MTKIDKPNQEAAPENQSITLTEGEMETLKEVMETYNQMFCGFWSS